MVFVRIGGGQRTNMRLRGNVSEVYSAQVCICINFHQALTQETCASLYKFLERSLCRIKERQWHYKRCTKKVKKVKESIAVNGTPSHSYGVSLAVWDHTVLPATRHKRTHPAFTLARQAGTRFTDHLRVEGWVSPGPGCKEQLAHCCYATARS